MKEIPLSQGKVALVDDEDFEWLNQWKWYAHKLRGGYWYAQINVHRDHKKVCLFMHHLIVGISERARADHKNGDTLDNRRGNLRPCTHGENSQNSRVQRWEGRTSKFKGVGWFKNTKKWRARIRADNKCISLGHFETELEAARAYDAAATQYHGEFACLNFPLPEVAQQERDVNGWYFDIGQRREKLLQGIRLPISHKSKTHCPQGHPYGEPKTRITASGKRRTERRCEICLQASRRRYEERIRLAATISV